MYPVPTLLLAIGNDARQDDGLGWAFAQALEANPPPGWHLEYRYQLQVEDAALIAEYERVIFADATHEALPKGYTFQRLIPAVSFAFTTHALPPAAVLALCQQVYEHFPQAWVLTIAGAQWELEQGLGHTAQRHLQAVLEALPHLLQQLEATT